MARGVPCLRGPLLPLPDEPESEPGARGELRASILSAIELMFASVGMKSVFDRARVGVASIEADLLCKAFCPGNGIAGADGLLASERRLASNSAAASAFFL